ncbi:helix-turn-helix transcriptional regulator [Microbacterium sp. NPDC077184]|uniref:helix-turn-helix domain-containing protein n=1 Tax=Microbacterium sp. NPDC077184 TaxID=3154764 RepID=UPI003414474B
MTTTSGVDWGAYAQDFAQRLVEARERAGLTQDAVARRAGIATFTYQKLEKGESNPGTPANPRLQTIVALAHALEIDVCDLVPRQA